MYIYIYYVYTTYVYLVYLCHQSHIIHIYIYIYIYDIQFTQETYNNQIYSKYACTWGRNKHEEIKEINNSAKIKKNVLAIVF